MVRERDRPLLNLRHSDIPKKKIEYHHARRKIKTYMESPAYIQEVPLLVETNGIYRTLVWKEETEMFLGLLAVF